MANSTIESSRARVDIDPARHTILARYCGSERFARSAAHDAFGRAYVRPADRNFRDRVPCAAPIPAAQQDGGIKAFLARFPDITGAVPRGASRAVHDGRSATGVGKAAGGASGGQS